MPAVCVLTPTFNRGPLLKGLFDSLCAQREKDFEWLIVDDGSTDDTEKVAKALCKPNFATNAVKYTPYGGCVEASLRRERGGITFTVSNDSAPLSEEALRRVWDTFYRADESRSGGGTGLGLAIARNIIELHGGRCFVYNTGTGVAFGFTL